MSTINVTNLSGRGGATPNLPDGANITGVATATSFDGNLKTTGTPTLGLGVTINASGVAISGVCTAGIGSFTTLYGDGSNLTGVGETIAPWNYNPDPNDTGIAVDTGIGITFNKKVVAGSGTATLKIVNAGVAGTTIQSWGVSSCTFATQLFTLGSLVSDLTIDKTYQIDIPSGFLVDSNETSYAGTAYTFTVEPAANKLWAAGRNSYGGLGQNNVTHYSSPTQVPGNNWGPLQGNGISQDAYQIMSVKTDGTLWSWGYNTAGALGLNQAPAQLNSASSPTQIGSDTTWNIVTSGYIVQMATKDDGTLWTWGYNPYGELGQNNKINYSSPVQIPGTTWSTADAKITAGYSCAGAIRTDGTLWTWGFNQHGRLGHNSQTAYSSPVQVPGTTWANVSISGYQSSTAIATKTDGTLWSWGRNQFGEQGDGQVAANRSSPVQIPGTTWDTGKRKIAAGRYVKTAIKTDGTLWVWGYNEYGGLGQNNETDYSSPVQIPGTSWKYISTGSNWMAALKTDGTVWTWGQNSWGNLLQNNRTNYSSPVQVGSGTDWTDVANTGDSLNILEYDTTP